LIVRIHKMMKNIKYIVIIVATVAILVACGDGKTRKPGTIYMPDMAYSRAYEAYTVLDTNAFTTTIDGRGHKAYFNAGAVNGAVKRGDLGDYPYADDSIGYVLSKNVINPLGELTKAELAEAGRLYNINCGVCHGEKGLANGPIADKIGAVANLTNPTYVSMTDGTMYHSLHYGKNNMGSYASQLTKKQRWAIIKYVRTLQPKPTVATASVDTSKKGK
jgi:mono/diheme cytochrome c family protein